MSQDNSYRQIIRSSSIIGGASAINIAIGLVRTKVAAMLLGPAGIGLVGMYFNFLEVASAVAGLGFGTIGTRQIAEAASTGDAPRIATARRALFWGTAGLALAGALAFWLLRKPLATHVLGNGALLGEVGWLALGVALTVAGTSQTALLRGLRRVGDIARVSISSAMLSTLVGVGALLLWDRSGLLVYVLVTPLASFVMGHWFVRKLPRLDSMLRSSIQGLAAQWRMLARLGFAFMIAGLAASVGGLAVRSLVQQELGGAALGHFQAAWAISLQYIGFVLAAMGTDFYPRLTTVIRDHSAVNALVNEQSEVALLLAAPIVLALTALAPWIIELLYTSDFSASTSILRWQVLGDLLKVVSWPLGFILLAAGAGKAYVFIQWIGALMLASASYLMLPKVGLQATGVAYVLMYCAVLALNYLSARRRTGFRWQRPVARLAIIMVMSAGCVAFASASWPELGASAGVILSVGAGVFALHRLRAKGALPRKVEVLLMKFRISK